MTVENFFKFYKEKYLSFLQEDGYCYILSAKAFLSFKNFSIENLPFKNSGNLNFDLKTYVRVVITKDKFNSQFEEFVKVIMDF